MYPIPPPPPYDPYPTIPPSSPQPNRPKRQIWRWYRTRHPLLQISLGCFTLLATLILGSFCAFGTAALVQGVRLGAQYTVATQTARAQGVPGKTHHPRMGGVLDDFVAQYGLPTKTAPDNETFTSGTVQITAYVNKSQTVNRIAISGPSTWTTATTAAYCEQFLPDGAQETNRLSGDATFVDYDSSLGKIVMQLQTATCLLFVSQ